MSILESIVGQHVIIRSYSSGVFAGVVKAAEASGPGRTRVSLQDSRRLWLWKAEKGIALSGVAQHGLVASASKIDSEIAHHVIDDVIEILPTTETAKESIDGTKK